jgi:hypothetical protein
MSTVCVALTRECARCKVALSLRRVCPKIRAAEVEMYRYRRRFWFEGAVSVLAAAATLVTSVWPAWIERSLGFSPDGGSGAVEVVVALALAAAAVAFASLAYAERRASVQRQVDGV